MESCSEDHHLCSLKELYTGGYNTARQMGWFRITTDIWTRNTDYDITTSADEIDDGTTFKLAVCCADK
jgi:hypothetical protein